MTIRPWWSGVPVVWSVWLSAAVAQVAPLAVTLAPDHDCPAPSVKSPLLRLPKGCPSPWAGVLYTEAHHADLRARMADVDALAVARGKQIEARSAALEACRTQRSEVTAACVVGVSRIQGQIQALADAASPEPRPALWPWAALSGGLAAAGAGAGALAGRGAGEVLGYGLAGLAVGTAVALMVERWGR